MNRQHAPRQLQSLVRGGLRYDGASRADAGVLPTRVPSVVHELRERVPGDPPAARRVPTRGGGLPSGPRAPRDSVPHMDFDHMDFDFEFLKGTYRSKKIFLLIRWSQSTHRSLSLKGLVKKVYRAFIVSVGKISSFSFCPP